MSIRALTLKRAKMKDLTWSNLTLLRVLLPKAPDNKPMRERKKLPERSSPLSSHNREEHKLSSIILPFKLRYAVSIPKETNFLKKKELKSRKKSLKIRPR